MAKNHPGQRLSLKGQLCTVRYIGPVADKTGEWLGVEWDDAARGKHDGTNGAVNYFACRSKSPTAASFLRSTQAWDKPRSCFQALEEKYLHKDDHQNDEIIFVSGKQAEEVGFEKFARRQAQLRGIHVVVLDRMRIRHVPDEAEAERMSAVCSHITDLDVGFNLFETFAEVAHLVQCLPKLKTLTVDGNRFSIGEDGSPFPGIQTLSLSATLFDWSEISELTRGHFTDIRTLVAANNALRDVRNAPIPDRVSTLDLSGNEFVCLENAWPKNGNDALRSVMLKQNRIGAVTNQSANPQSTPTEDLDLAHNAIASWSFFNALPQWAPHLKSLRVTGNPLYTNGLKSADGKLLTTEDGYMLTIARLPTLETLNYSKITEKERLNAETYYLNQIAAEVALLTEDKEVEVLSHHPRWKALCDEYGPPAIHRKSEGAGADVVDPNSLTYRLAALTFSFTPPASNERARSWTQLIPKSFTIYAVLGLVAKELNLSPMTLRLVWQTGERDPGIQQGGEDMGVEEWDSSDDGDEYGGLEGRTGDGEDLGEERQVELVPGTRLLGSYVEGREARLRVEVVSMR